MREWFKAGAVPGDFPPKARDGNSSLVVICASGIRHWVSGPHPMVVEQVRCAWGSGRDFAEAAMWLGHDARRGVEVACHFQTDCGNGIDVLALDVSFALKAMNNILNDWSTNLPPPADA
jgi:hypothetical protein